MKWLASAATALLLLGWWGGQAWYASHVHHVTGRPDVSGVSCLHCHRRVQPPPTRGAPSAPRPAGSRFVSPLGLAVSPDGSLLYVAASGSDELLEVALPQRRIRRRVPLPARPHAVSLSADGRRLAVSCRDAGMVVVLDAGSLEVVESRAAGREPAGVVLRGDRVIVADVGADVVRFIDGHTAPTAVATGREPYGVAASGPLVAVVARLTDPVAFPRLPASEVTFLNARSGRVVDRRLLVSAHLAEDVVLSADASFALVPAIRFRNLLPTVQVDRGAVMTAVLALVETAADGRTLQFPLDEVNAFHADPAAVALTPDDRTAFVAHAGVHQVTAVDLEAMRAAAGDGEALSQEELADDLGVHSRYVRARIPTRENPRALALTPDGAWVLVAEHLADSVAIIDTHKLEVIGRIDLEGPRRLTAVRRGERVFHDATGTFQGQFSCRSCHPDGHTDGLIWDFEIDGIGVNRVDTRSLRGIRDTAPFKWNGKNPDLATQCGPRFSRVLMRSEPFGPGQLTDLVAFIESIPLPPPPLLAIGAEQARARGERIFNRARTVSGEEIPKANRCPTCHRPPLFTDRLKTDVGTGGAFDTPHLIDIGSSAPFLHDGRALTLEEIWTVHSPEDTHGVTSDLTKVELNDLVLYLRSL